MPLLPLGAILGWSDLHGQHRSPKWNLPSWGPSARAYRWTTHTWGEFDDLLIGALVAMLVYIPGKLASLAAILVRHRPVDIDKVLLISIYYHNTAALPLHEFYSPGGQSAQRACHVRNIIYLSAAKQGYWISAMTRQRYEKSPISVPTWENFWFF